MALDIVEQAARRAPPRGASTPRASVRTLTIGVAGDPVVRQFGTAAQLATLVWEVLALEVADTDEMPFSDPPTDLPDEVGDVLMSLSVRPASSIADLRARTGAVFAKHASARDDVVGALTTDPASAAPAHTPVVPANPNPNRITMPAPAMTVARLRTISKHDPPAVKPSPQVNPLPQQAERKPAPRFTLAKRTESSGAMPAVSIPTPSEVASSADAPRAVEEVLADAVSVPATVPEAPVPGAGVASPEPSKVVASPRVSVLATSVLTTGESARPSRGTLDPWGESAQAVDVAAPRPRRRVWPFVAGALIGAAALAIIGWQTSRSAADARDTSAAAADTVASAAASSLDRAPATSAEPPRSEGDPARPPATSASPTASAVAPPASAPQTAALPPIVHGAPPNGLRPRSPAGATTAATLPTTTANAPVMASAPATANAPTTADAPLPAPTPTDAPPPPPPPPPPEPKSSPPPPAPLAQ